MRTLSVAECAGENFYMVGCLYQSDSDVRVCRCPLFLTANVLIHPPKIADAETDPGFSKPVAVACTEKELFIEPVVWMKDDIMKTSGKLSCQKCKKKIGTFSWIGKFRLASFLPILLINSLVVIVV